MEKDFWSKLCYGKVPKEFYKDNKKILDETNYISVKIAYIFASVLFAVLTIIALINAEVANTRIMYGAGTVLMGIITLVVLKWLVHHKKYTRIFYYFFEVLAFAAAIIAGTYFSPNDLAVQFFVLLIVLPLLYIERPINSILMSMVAGIVFVIVSFAIKGTVSYHAGIDLLNVICSLLIGIFFIYYVRNMHLTNIQATMILQLRSETDGLTQVLNKVSAEKAGENYLRYNSLKDSCVMMILDIDEFKKVNDTLGHRRGDELLKKIGNILKGIFREGDIIGRIGGDEFMVLMKNIHDLHIAEGKAKKIIQEISDIPVEYSKNHCGCSIGIVYNNKQGFSYTEMYGMADRALYRAKGRGKGQYVVYEEEHIVLNKQLSTMLVVDDTEISRAVLQTCFEKEYNIIQAENGKQALEYMDTYADELDVVLLDLEMPIMNGYEVLKIAQKKEKLRNIPILVITAFGQNELLALELGAVDLIAKPYDPLIVKKRVANAVARSSRG